MKKLLDDMRRNVVSYNKYLKFVIKEMDYDMLYMNCHPLDRVNFERRKILILR